jgi:hypothetical protein
MKRCCLLVLLCLSAASAVAATPPYSPLAVKAAVPAYRVQPNLSNVVNLAQFGKLTAAQKALLAKNAFFVAPSDDKQLYFAYENNDYLVLPNFISCDTVLQLYHIFFDYSLREVEAERLIPLCEQLTARMYAGSQRIWQQATDPGVRQAALKNVAYFGVAMRQPETVRPL